MSSGMFQEGFLFDELSEFKQDILRSIDKDYPQETAKFIKEEAGKLKKVAQKTARKEVKRKSGRYFKSFKVGKKYKYDNDTCIRAYNNAPHAHLIEYGHVNVPRGEKRATTRKGRAEQAKNRKGVSFTLGAYVFNIAELDFRSQFFDDCELFMIQYVDNTVQGKRKNG